MIDSSPAGSRDGKATVEMANGHGSQTTESEGEKKQDGAAAAQQQQQQPEQEKKSVMKRVMGKLDLDMYEPLILTRPGLTG